MRTTSDVLVVDDGACVVCIAFAMAREAGSRVVAAVVQEQQQRRGRAAWIPHLFRRRRRRWRRRRRRPLRWLGRLL